MKTRRDSGLTLVEVLFLIFILAVLISLIFPAMTRPPRSSRISCVSNVKQIGLAFRMWAYDHGEKMPMELSTAQGGTRDTALEGLPLASFSIISNELNNPKPLTCGDDKDRIRTANWAGLSPKNLSYFLGVSASETNPYTLLAGDRNIMISGKPVKGFVQVTNSSTVTWGPNIHKHQGNIGLADGSAHQITDSLLQKSLESTRLATNRFAVP